MTGARACPHVIQEGGVAGGVGGEGGAGGQAGEGGAGGGANDPSTDVGTACQSDDDCEQRCFSGPDFPGGYCTASCVEVDCAEGDECFIFGDDDAEAYCLKTCTEGADCREDEGYECDVDDTCFASEAGPPPMCADDHEPNDTEATATNLGDRGADCDAPRVRVEGIVSADDTDWFQATGVGSDVCPIFSRARHGSRSTAVRPRSSTSFA